MPVRTSREQDGKCRTGTGGGALHTDRTTHGRAHATSAPPRDRCQNPPLRLFSGPRSKRSKIGIMLLSRNADAVVHRKITVTITIICLDHDVNRMAGPEPDGV